MPIYNTQSTTTQSAFPANSDCDLARPGPDRGLARPLPSRVRARPQHKQARRRLRFAVGDKAGRATTQTARAAGLSVRNLHSQRLPTVKGCPQSRAAGRVLDACTESTTLLAAYEPSMTPTRALDVRRTATPDRASTTWCVMKDTELLESSFHHARRQTELPRHGSATRRKKT